MDAKEGTNTEVSTTKREKIILSLTSPYSKPSDFRRLGHTFPLKYKERRVLQRFGHTEASADLPTLARLNPTAVLYDIVDDDGSGSLTKVAKIFKGA